MPPTGVAVWPRRLSQVGAVELRRAALTASWRETGIFFHFVTCGRKHLSLVSRVCSNQVPPVHADADNPAHGERLWGGASRLQQFLELRRSGRSASHFATAAAAAARAPANHHGLAAEGSRHSNSSQSDTDHRRSTGDTGCDESYRAQHQGGAPSRSGQRHSPRCAHLQDEGAV